MKHIPYILILLLAGCHSQSPVHTQGKVIAVYYSKSSDSQGNYKSVCYYSASVPGARLWCEYWDRHNLTR